jgi:hypothetical protein
MNMKKALLINFSDAFLLLFAVIANFAKPFPLGGLGGAFENQCHPSIAISAPPTAAIFLFWFCHPEFVEGFP